MEKICRRKKGHPPTQATLDEPTFQIFPWKTRPTVYTRNKKLAGLKERPVYPGHSFVMVGFPSFTHTNIVPCPAGSTLSRRDNKGIRTQALFQTIKVFTSATGSNAEEHSTQFARCFVYLLRSRNRKNVQFPLLSIFIVWFTVMFLSSIPFIYL